jgi:hypothetical protein
VRFSFKIALYRRVLFCKSFQLLVEVIGGVNIKVHLATGLLFLTLSRLSDAFQLAQENF